MKNLFLGIDIGSVSIKTALLDENDRLISSTYDKSIGNPIKGLKTALNRIQRNIPSGYKVLKAGTTGSGRKLIGLITGSNVIKNEIISHAIAGIHFNKDVNTIIDIGGQDSKLIIIRDKIVIDFSMNSVCAAGTGSFLEQQSNRLNIPIEKFGDIALSSNKTVNIAGRCSVFAESDMISLQQLGERKANIINGLCFALCRNYVNNLAGGKTIEEPILFQGGVAANKGIVRAFQEIFQKKIIVPKDHNIMGAIGVALIAKNYNSNNHSEFNGFNIVNKKYASEKFICDDCENSCNIMQVTEDGKIMAYWGDRCGKWHDKV